VRFIPDAAETENDRRRRILYSILHTHLPPLDIQKLCIMSYYDNSNSSDYSWKQQHPSPDTATADYANNNQMNNSSSPSFNFTNSYNSAVAENYTNTEANGNFHAGDFDNAAGSGISNSYFNNHNINNVDTAIATNNIHINPACTLNNNQPIEEELQVVPDSLDHLSRDELCRMIYRLDYERNALQDKLETALRDNQLNNAMNSNKKKGKKRPRTCNPHGADADNADSEQQQPEPATTAADGDPFTILDTPPTPFEMQKVQKRLGQNVISAVKSAVHGGRKIPKSTVTEGNMNLSMISAIMQDYHDKKMSETKRMVKWSLTEDGDIANVLKSGERLVHPVKHDGTGYIIPAGSSPANIYNWAKFVGMEMKYDKRELTLTVIAKTTAAGSGRPECVPEKVKYSRGEREDL